MTCISGACMYGHFLAEGVCLLPRNCYKTISLDDASIVNSHH